MTEELKTTNLQPTTGCLIDGHWGQYVSIRLIEIAEEFGHELCEDDRRALAAYIAAKDEFDGECGEKHNAADWILTQGGLADDAEKYLNENVAREGFAFGWQDGEFFYMNTEWFEQD